MRGKVLLALALVVPVTAGCMGFGGGVESKYEDANQRFTNSVSGGTSETRSFTIPSGTSQLTVKLAFDVSGGANFDLRNPLGVTVQDQSVGGANSADNSNWYATQNPMAGTWTFEVSVGGTGAYAVGIYYS